MKTKKLKLVLVKGEEKLLKESLRKLFGASLSRDHKIKAETLPAALLKTVVKKTLLTL